MKGYGQYCPVAKAAEVFAERWTPLILRELLLGSSHFSDLHRGVPLNYLVTAYHGDLFRRQLRFRL